MFIISRIFRSTNPIVPPSFFSFLIRLGVGQSSAILISAHMQRSAGEDARMGSSCAHCGCKEYLQDKVGSFQSSILSALFGLKCPHNVSTYSLSETV